MKPAISILGTRGIPAQYGGFETVAEQLGENLVQALVNVTVYGFKLDPNLKSYKGIRLIKVPVIKGKITETLSATFFSTIKALFSKSKIMYVMNVANSPFCLLLWLFNKKVILNVNGLEWERKKWGKIAKTYYRFATWLAVKLPIRLIVDSRKIQDYYQTKYNRQTNYLTYGSYLESSTDPNLLQQFNLKNGEYFLITARLEPENNIDLIINAYNKIKTEKKLVIVGEANYKSRYVEKLKKMAYSKILFLGSVYNPDSIRELFCNCYAYIHGHEVGGTNPSLLKAMGCGCLILALDVPFNREVLAEGGIFFSKDQNNLTDRLVSVLDKRNEYSSLISISQDRIKDIYNWNKITSQYLELFHSILKGNH